MRCLYKYPQRAFPYARAGRGEPPPRPRRAGVRAARHRRLRRATATSMSFVEYAKADRRRHPDPHHGRQPRPGGRADPRAADGLVPQHLVVGRHGERPAARRDAPMRPALRSSRSTSRTTAAAGCYCDGHAGAALHRERDQHAAAVRQRTARGYAKDGINDAVVDGAPSAVNPERRGHQGGGALPASIVPAGGSVDAPAAAAPTARPARRPTGRSATAFERIVRDAAARSRRVLRRPSSPALDRRRAAA